MYGAAARSPLGDGGCVVVAAQGIDRHELAVVGRLVVGLRGVCGGVASTSSEGVTEMVGCGIENMYPDRPLSLLLRSLASSWWWWWLSWSSSSSTNMDLRFFGMLVDDSDEEDEEDDDGRRPMPSRRRSEVRAELKAGRAGGWRDMVFCVSGVVFV
jgi:hypothetical protein